MVSIVIECERNKLEGLYDPIVGSLQALSHPLPPMKLIVSPNDIFSPVLRVEHAVFDEEDGEGGREGGRCGEWLLSREYYGVRCIEHRTPDTWATQLEALVFKFVYVSNSPPSYSSMMSPPKI